MIRMVVVGLEIRTVGKDHRKSEVECALGTGLAEYLEISDNWDRC